MVRKMGPRHFLPVSQRRNGVHGNYPKNALNKAYTSDSEAVFLDLNLFISNDTVS